MWGITISNIIYKLQHKDFSYKVIKVEIFINVIRESSKIFYRLK